MGILSWAKYSKIIIDAEKEFNEKYNFQMTIEERTVDAAQAIAITEIFERCRAKKLSPENVIELMFALRKSSPLYSVLTYGMSKSQNPKTLAPSYGKMYYYYNSARIEGLSTLDSIIKSGNTVSSLTHNITDNVSKPDTANVSKPDTSNVASNSKSTDPTLDKELINKIIWELERQSSLIKDMYKLNDNWSCGYILAFCQEIKSNVNGRSINSDIDFSKIELILKYVIEELNLNNDTPSKIIKLKNSPTSSFQDGVDAGLEDFYDFLRFTKISRRWARYLTYKLI